MKKQTGNNKILSIFFCLGLFLPVMASANVEKNGSTSEATRITISDLDLSQKEGIETLYNRLKSGANEVCGDKYVEVTGSRIASAKIRQEHRKCTAKALDRAVKNINNKMLSDYHSINS